MPCLTEIEQRTDRGLLPLSKLPKKQQEKIKANNIPPDLKERYFGRTCRYWKIDKTLIKPIKIKQQ